MRFMILVKASKESEAGVLPDEKLLVAMGRFNEELTKAGVLLDGAGLKPSSAGVRVRFEDDGRTLIDGPFAETKELVSGYWVLQVKSKEEAIAWIKRAPFGSGAEVEIRPFFEPGDFQMGPEAQAVHDKVAADLARRQQQAKA